jgi:hypothetical protein
LLSSFPVILKKEPGTSRVAVDDNKSNDVMNAMLATISNLAAKVDKIEAKAQSSNKYVYSAPPSPRPPGQDKKKKKKSTRDLRERGQRDLAKTLIQSGLTTSCLKMLLLPRATLQRRSQVSKKRQDPSRETLKIQPDQRLKATTPVSGTFEPIEWDDLDIKGRD